MHQVSTLTKCCKAVHFHYDCSRSRSNQRQLLLFERGSVHKCLILCWTTCTIMHVVSRQQPQHLGSSLSQLMLTKGVP